MKTMTALAFLVLVALLAACGPSQADEDAAIATQVALLLEQQGAEAAQPSALPPVDEGDAAGDGDAAGGDTTSIDGPLPSEASCVPEDSQRALATVTDIWDGDSIQVNINGQSFEVRYIGIDAPDGDAPREANRLLVEGKQILLIRDVTDVDEDGRLQRYVIADGVFVNYELVRQGAAFPSPEEPDLSCRNRIEDALP